MKIVHIFPRSQGNLRLGLVSPLKPNRWNLSAQIMLEIDRRVGEGFLRPKTTSRNKQKQKTKKQTKKIRRKEVYQESPNHSLQTPNPKACLIFASAPLSPAN